MAQITYNSLSDVPEDLRDHAKEVEGKYTVKVAPAEKITEFRENNVKLSQERDSLNQVLTKYETVTGVPLAEIKKLEDFAKSLETLRETKKRVDDGVLVENTSLEEASAQRVTEVTNSFKAQLADLARDRDAQRDRVAKAEQRANNMMIENALRLVASDPEVGMIESAVKHLLPEAFHVFRVEDNGRVVPKTADGTIIYGTDGVNPMTVKEWMLRQRETSAYLFKGSNGGGSGGSIETNGGRVDAAAIAKMSPAERINYARKHGLA